MAIVSPKKIRNLATRNQTLTQVFSHFENNLAAKKKKKQNRSWSAWCFLRDGHPPPHERGAYQTSQLLFAGATAMIMDQRWNGTNPPCLHECLIHKRHP
jgi:hypothetical protein